MSRAGASAATGARRGLAGLAAGGIMAGHWLAYAVREPDAGARAILLEATGHHLLPQLSLLALVGAIAALLAVPRGAGAATPRFAEVARGLILLQIGGFALLEAGERLVAHGPQAGLAQLLEPGLLLGFAAQVAVGAAGAALVAGLARLTLRRPITHPAGAVPFTRPVLAPPARWTSRPGADTCTLRGPPVPTRT